MQLNWVIGLSNSPFLSLIVEKLEKRINYDNDKIVTLIMKKCKPKIDQEKYINNNDHNVVIL